MRPNSFPRTIQYGSPINRRHPLARRLGAMWLVLPRRYGGGRWLDLPGNRHGTLTNMAPSATDLGWGATTRQGGDGELRFTGADAHVNIPDHQELQLNGAFTISFFVFIRTNAGNIITKFVNGSASASNDLRGIRLQTTSLFVTQLGANPLSASTTAYLNTWLHVVVTSHAAGSEMTFNGISVSTSGTSLNQWFNNNGPVRFGRAEAVFFGSGSGPFIGALDAVLFHSRSMALDEMKALTREARLGFPGLLNFRELCPLSPPGVGSPDFLWGTTGAALPRFPGGVRGGGQVDTAWFMGPGWGRLVSGERNRLARG